MERSGKNSGKNPPLCTGELDTTPSLQREDNVGI